MKTRGAYNMSKVFLENVLEEVREEFKINDLSSANWAFKKLRAIGEKINKIKEAAEKEHLIIEEWEVREVKALEKEKEYFEGLINAYYIEERAIDKKFKLSTPYGKVTARKSKKWTYDDEVVKEYIKAENLPYIKVKEELDKTGLKKEFKDGINPMTGEIIPGITIEEVENISIKVGE